MARFCQSCGFALGSTTTFCSAVWGVAANVRRRRTPVTPQSGAPALSARHRVVRASRFSWWCLVCLGVGGAGSNAHGRNLLTPIIRVKEVVMEKAKENGVDLNIVPPATTTVNHHKTHKPCDLLSKEERRPRCWESRSKRPSSRIMRASTSAPPGLAAKLAGDQAGDHIQESAGTERAGRRHGHNQCRRSVGQQYRRGPE